MMLRALLMKMPSLNGPVGRAPLLWEALAPRFLVARPSYVAGRPRLLSQPAWNQRMDPQDVSEEGVDDGGNEEGDGEDDDEDDEDGEDDEEEDDVDPDGPRERNIAINPESALDFVVQPSVREMEEFAAVSTSLGLERMDHVDLWQAVALSYDSFDAHQSYMSLSRLLLLSTQQTPSLADPEHREMLMELCGRMLEQVEFLDQERAPLLFRCLLFFFHSLDEASARQLIDELAFEPANNTFFALFAAVTEASLWHARIDTLDKQSRLDYVGLVGDETPFEPDPVEIRPNPEQALELQEQQKAGRRLRRGGEEGSGEEDDDELIDSDEDKYHSDMDKYQLDEERGLVAQELIEGLDLELGEDDDDDDGDDQIDEGVTSTSERDLAQLDISNHDGNHDDAPDDMVGIEDFDDGDSNSDDEGEEEEDFEVDIGTDEEAEAAAAHQPVVGNEAGHGSGDELLDMSAADVPLDENSVVLLLKQLLLTELKHHNLSPEEAREARTKFHFLKRILGRAYRHVDERNPMALNTEARIAWQAPLVVLRKSYQVMTARRPDLADPSELKHQLIQRVPWESQRVLQDFDSDGDEDTHDILPGITRDDLEDILNDSSHRVLDPDTDDGSHHHHHHHHHRHQQQQQQQQQSNSDKQYNSLLEVLGARPPK